MLVILITAQPGANIIETVDSVRAPCRNCALSCLATISVAVASDRTNSIRASLHEIEVTLLISIILVMVVVSAFLRSAAPRFIPSGARPSSHCSARSA
jgi:multidrug efflux pump